MMSNTCSLSIRSLPYLFRLGIASLIITLLGGYVVSGLHLRWHYDNRDETPGLTMNDIIGAYHGVQTPSPLISALENGHPDTLPDTERTTLLDWLRSDRVSQDYDNLDLGEDAPSELIAMSCLDCHTRSSSGANTHPEVPLEYWDDIQKIAISKDIQPAGIDIVATSQHTHAPMMAIVMLVLALLGAMTRFSNRIIGFVVFVTGIGLLVDMAGWWITREVAGFAFAIVVGGGLYAIGTMLIGCIVIIDCVLPAGNDASAS
ncbi:MAG: hypothetical protein P1U42_02390 [Phycisphaerales bacterium]|nr:hypothetical protein [Phycisphaerales bacterium]